MKSITIFWFRRDLRIEDNCGLFYALKENKNVLPIFIYDVNILNNFFGEFEELFEIHFVFEPILFVFPLLYFYLISTINIKRKIWYYFFFIPGIILNI